MKLLLDQGIPRSAAQLLRDSGLDAVHVGEVDMARSTDREILRLAEKEGRTCVTIDADFHALLAISGASVPSVIRIRQEGLNGEALFKLLCSILSKATEAINQGALITATSYTMRIKHLPVTNPHYSRNKP